MEMETGLNLTEKESGEGNQDNDFSRSKRFSILKTSKGLSEDNTATIRSSRRVSFSSNYIKAFMSDDDKNTIWDTTVEEVISNNESTISSNNVCQGNDHFNTSVFFNSSDMDMELTSTDSNVSMEQKENMQVKENIPTPFLETKNLFMTEPDKENIPVLTRVPLLSKKLIQNKPLQIIGKENDPDIMLSGDNRDDLVMDKENIPVTRLGSNCVPVFEEKNMTAPILRKKPVGLIDQKDRFPVLLNKENISLLSMKKIDNPIVVKESIPSSQDDIIPVVFKNEDEMEFTCLSSTLTSNEGEMEFTCKHSTLKASEEEIEFTCKNPILRLCGEKMEFTKNPILNSSEEEMEFTCKNPILKPDEEKMEIACKNSRLKPNEEDMEFTCKNTILKSKDDMKFGDNHSLINRNEDEMEFTCRNPMLKSKNNTEFTGKQSILKRNEEEMEFTCKNPILNLNEDEMEFTCKNPILKSKDHTELTGKHSILSRKEETMEFTCKNIMFKWKDHTELTGKHSILNRNEETMEFTCKNPIFKPNEDGIEFTCRNPILKSKDHTEFTGKDSILNRNEETMEFTCKNPIFKPKNHMEFTDKQSILRRNEEEMEFTCKNPILNQKDHTEFTDKHSILNRNERTMEFTCNNPILIPNEETMEFTCKNPIFHPRNDMDFTGTHSASNRNEGEMEFTCKKQILKQNEDQMEFTCRNPALTSRDDMTRIDKHSILNRSEEKMEFTCKNLILQQNEEEMDFTCKNPVLKQNEDEMEFTCKNPILKRNEPVIENACKKPKLSSPYSERKIGACYLQDSKLVDDTIDRDFVHRANDKTISNISNMNISDMIAFVPEKVPATSKYNLHFDNREVSDDFTDARVTESPVSESPEKGINNLNNPESQKFSSENIVSTSNNITQEDIDTRPKTNSSTLSNLSKNIPLFPKEIPSFVDQSLTSKIVVEVPTINSPERTFNLSCESLKKHPAASSTLKNEYHIPNDNIAQVESEIECRHRQNSSKKDLSLSVSNIGSANTSLGNTTDFLLKNISTLSQGMYDTQQLLRAASGMNKSKNYDETSIETKIPKAGINTTYLVGSMENKPDKEVKTIEIEADCIEERDTDIFSKCQNSEKSDMYSIDKEVSIDLIDSSAEDLPRVGSENNGCNNDSKQIQQERQTSDDHVTENSKAEERIEDSSTLQSSNQEDYVPWNKTAFLEARQKRMKHFEDKLKELKIPELKLDDRVTEMCEKLRNLNKIYSKYSLNLEEKYLSFQKYRNKILEECVLNYGIEKVDDAEDGNFNSEEIEEEAPSILQEIMIKSRMSDCNWKFVRAEDGIAYFTTLFGTLEFSSKYQSYDEIITNLKTVSFLTEKSQPIMHLLQKELLHTLTRERIINCIGHCNNILSLLDYIQMGMEKIKTQYATWKEIERTHKLSLTTDYKASFVIINVDLIVKWIFSVDLSNLEHISKDSVDVSASVGLVDKKHVLKLVEECPKCIDFLHSYINKIETYMGTLLRMR